MSGGEDFAPVSVVILASRPAQLRRCLESVARADLPRPREVLVALNGCRLDEALPDGPPDGLPGLRPLELPASTLGGARNSAVKAAAHELLCFLDDDVTVPPEYFRVLMDKARRYPQAAAIGGPNLTPDSSGPFQRSVGLLLESRFGAGPMRRRYAGFPGDRWTDDRGLILCNLVLRREVLRGEGLAFDERMERNEENLLLARILSKGGRALHCPDLYVHHERRGSLREFCRQCFLSGMGRAQMTARMPRSLRPDFLFPPLLLVCVLAAPAKPAFFGPLLALYACVSVACAALGAAALGRSMRGFLGLLLLFPAGHLSYGAGFLACVARPWRRG